MILSTTSSRRREHTGPWRVSIGRRHILSRTADGPGAEAQYAPGKNRARAPGDDPRIGSTMKRAPARDDWYGIDDRMP